MSLTPLSVLWSLLLLSTLGLSFATAIPQDPAYHDYADQRLILGIPYFWNVISNLPMFFIGLYGLRKSWQRWPEMPTGVARWIPFTLSFGIFITSFGSAYYHYMPDNSTLLWDRLPMTLMFMSLFSLLVYDYVGARAGENAFLISVPLGVASVLYWHFTEAAGHGDLRPYALVQFFPMLAVPVLMLGFPRKTSYGKYILLLLGWYVAAKLCEHFDRPLYAMTGFWSGHTLKHLAGAIGLVYAMKVVDQWEPAPKSVPA